MKKFFTLVAMATMALAASAQTENAWVNQDLVTDDAGSAIAGGTVLAASENVSMMAAYDDTYKKVSMTGADDAVNNVTIDGVIYEVNANGGLQGQTNPATNSIGAATDGYYVGGQTSGAVFKFEVKKDGLLFVFGKLTYNKNYYVWEGDVPNGAGTLVAYRLAGSGVAAANGTVDYTLPAADGDNLADAAAIDANADKYLASGKLATASVIDPNFVTGNALGVVIAPVYAEAGTYYVNACGSKITSDGFVFIPKDAPTAADVAAVSVSFAKSETAIAGVAEAKAEAAAPVKVIKNGQIVIGNYNIAGQQVK